MLVPPLPPLADHLLADHADAHRTLQGTLDAVSPQARRLFVRLQRRIFTESLAYVQPLVADPAEQLLFPAPRAFLTRTQELRVVAAAAVFRFLDSRLAMLRHDMIERTLDTATPRVLHALMEGVAPSGVETNAGMVRATLTAWRPEASTFLHPPAAQAGAMLEAAVDMALHAPAPAVARAGWLTFAVLSIHPFVDGNGRTSRSLYHLVAMEDPDVGFDWGIAEQWAVARRAYIKGLAAGQQVEVYDPEGMDPLPFMELCAVASAVGARLCAARATALQERLDAFGEEAGLNPDAAMLALAVALQRVAALSELKDVLVPDVESEPPELVPMATALVQAGHLAWAPRPPSRRTRTVPEPIGLVPSPALLALVR